MKIKIISLMDHLRETFVCEKSIYLYYTVTRPRRNIVDLREGNRKFIMVFCVTDRENYINFIW